MRTRNTWLLAGGLGCAFLACSIVCSGQTKRNKPRVQLPTRGIKGTAQLPGDNGKIGQTYTLGKGTAARNFTLTKVDYNATRLLTEDNTITVNRDEKLLVLHYTVQNPNPAANYLGARVFRFTCYDADGTTYTFHGDENACKDPTGDVMSPMLQPGQKAAVMTAMKIPARTAIVKLMVEQGDGNPVLRINLAPKDITPLAAPFVAPSSADGSEALPEIPGKSDAYMPFSPFDVQFLGVKYDTRDPDGTVLSTDSGDKWAIASFKFKNVSRKQADAGFGSEVRTSAGDKVGGSGHFKLATDGQLGSSRVDPGEELGMRVAYRIPKNDTVNRLSIWFGENGRKIIYPVE